MQVPYGEHSHPTGTSSSIPLKDLRKRLPLRVLSTSDWQHWITPLHARRRPAEWDNEAERQERVRPWRELDHPHRDAFPGDPREWEKQHATRAQLTPLGERLLGLARW
jgi:hypothetical protein